MKSLPINQELFLTDHVFIFVLSTFLKWVSYLIWYQIENDKDGCISWPDKNSSGIF